MNRRQTQWLIFLAMDGADLLRYGHVSRDVFETTFERFQRVVRVVREEADAGRK